MGIISNLHNLQAVNAPFKSITVEAKKDKVEILFVGDTSFGENYQQVIKERGGENILEKKGYDYPLEKLKNILMGASLVVANLETTIAAVEKSPFIGKKDYIHWSDVKKAPQYLFKNNIHCVNLANNHSFDYGEEGFKQTLQALQVQGIAFFGGGVNSEEAEKPLLIKITHQAKEYCIVVIGAFERNQKYEKEYKVYAEQDKSGIQVLDIGKISEQVLNIKKQYPEAIVILSPHWGNNYEWRTTKQKDIAETLIKQGVDLIIGHGAHRIQEIERIGSHWAIYGIGNFMFNSPGRYTKGSPAFSLIVKLVCSFSENLQVVIRVYPILTNNKVTNYQSRPLTDFEFNDFLQSLNLRSRDLALYGEMKRDDFGHFLELPLKAFDKSSVRKKEGGSMPCVGMLCNVILQQDVGDKYIPWICRSWVMDKVFKRENLNLFMYSPKHIDPATGIAKGYFIENDKYVLKERSVPDLNYDWCMLNYKSSETGMSYDDFFNWIKGRNIAIYPFRKVTDIARNKNETYLLIKKHNTTIQPESEKYNRDPHQLNAFFNKNNLVFLKPIAGNHGEGIIIIEKGINKRGADYYLLNHYLGVERREVYCKSWNELLDVLNKKTANYPYVIQMGVRSLRHEGAAFNIRVIMVHDGREWQWVHEIRASSHFSAISTYPFLGRSYPLKDFLPTVLSQDRMDKLMKDLWSASLGIVKYFDAIYPEVIGELAFDFVVDEACQIYLAEINTKPGVIGDPNVIQDFFGASFYGEQTELYASYLAKFFKKKLQL